MRREVSVSRSSRSIAQTAFLRQVLFVGEPISHPVFSVKTLIEQCNRAYFKYPVNKNGKLWSRRLAQIQQKRVSAQLIQLFHPGAMNGRLFRTPDFSR